MNHRMRLPIAMAGVAVTLLGTVLSAVAAGPLFQRANLAAPVSRPAGENALACTKMTAGDVSWVTFNEDDEVDEVVESYPSDTTEIGAIFDYNCVPKNTTIVTVFTYEGEQVYSDKEKLKASSSEGTYLYSIVVNEGTLDEGEWGVEFYNNKTLLTEGTVAVGDADCGDNCNAGEPVTVAGVVSDKKTKKPIKGAVFVVLNPGVTVEDWVDNDQSEDDIYAAATTDSKGLFELDQPLERNVEYSIIVAAKGYKPVAMDGFVVTDEDEDPLELTITLTK